MQALTKFARSFLYTQELVAGGALQSSYGLLDEPTVLVFEPIFNFGMPTGLFADVSNVNSALAYLQRVGETARFTKLQQVIDNLKLLVNDSAWSFKSVTGFSDIMHRKHEEIIIDNAQLQFMMHESLDMRVSSIINSINEIVYDQYRQVEVVPRNLQEFSMALLIHEMRIFNDNNQVASTFLKQTADNPDVDIMTTNHHLLHFGKCRFMQTSGKSLFETFDNENINIAGTNIDIEYRTFARTYNFNSIVNIERTESDNALLNSFNSGKERLNSSTQLIGNTGSLSNVNTRKQTSIINISDLDNYTNKSTPLVKSNSSTIANAIINGTTDNTFATKQSENVYADTTVSSMLNSRKTLNSYFEDALNLMSNLGSADNNLIQQLIQTEISSIRLNKRRSINIYEQ